MIIKWSDPPLEILAREALLKRVLTTEEKKSQIVEDLARRKAGWKGEETAKYYMKFLDQDRYRILYDIRVPHENEFFQIDILLLCREYVVIIEVKNLSGEIFLDRDYHQLIRTRDGVKEGFLDPVSQVHYQELQLRHYLKQHNLNDLPIFTFVTFTNSSSIVQTNNESIFQKVLPITRLPQQVAELEKNVTRKRLSRDQLTNISESLAKIHVPKQPNVLQVYRIIANDIKTGVMCSKCDHLPMTRVHGSWFCARCKDKTPSAHHQTLSDYFLLFGSLITNKQARQFLHLSSADTSYRLLKALNVPSIGHNKSIYYQLSPFFMEMYKGTK